MVINEISKNVRRYIILRITAVFVLSFCLFTVNILFGILGDVKQISTHMTSSSGEKEGIKLTDNMDETKTLSIFFSDLNRLNDLKSFGNELETSEEFEYIVTYQNPLSITYSPSIPTDMYAYEDKSLTNISGYDMLTVNSIQINERVKDFYPILVSEGRNLMNSDYTYSGNNINILLGNGYRNDFYLGETTKLEYWGIIFDATIVGFLEPNSFFMRQDMQIYLENHIVVPFLSCPESPATEEEIIFQGITYTSFINGVAFANDGFEIANITNKIDSLCQKYDIPVFGYEGMNSNSVRFLNYVIQLGANNIFLLVCINLIMTCMSFSIIQLYIFSKNEANYSIHILNGASRNVVAVYVSIDILSQFLLSLLLSLIAFSLTTGTLFFNLLPIIIAFQITIIPLIIVYSKIFNGRGVSAIKLEENEE